MSKIYLDPGHGGSDPGATGQGLIEKDLTLKIASFARDYLQSHFNNALVRMSRTEDTAKSLTQRTNEANRWGADIYVSIHINAFNGSANGYEDFIYNQLSQRSEAAKLQLAIHEKVAPLFNTDRGKKKANFHVLRESSMPAVLTENGFIDNRSDAEFLKSDNNLKKIGQAHGEGIAAYLGLSRSETSDRPVENPSDTYIVKSGDTLSKIARDNNTTVAALAKLNNINNPDLIRVGQEIKLSGSVPSSEERPQGDMQTNSIVDYLKSVNEDSSFSNRMKLAAQFGIQNYRGTASQNTQLLKKLRG